MIILVEGQIITNLAAKFILKINFLLKKKSNLIFICESSLLGKINKYPKRGFTITDFYTVSEYMYGGKIFI